MCQDINFSGSKTTLSVESGGEQVAVNCGKGSCVGMCFCFKLESVFLNSCVPGPWSWSELSVSGGSAGELVNFSDIEGWSLA